MTPIPRPRESDKGLATLCALLGPVVSCYEAAISLYLTSIQLLKFVSGGNLL